MVLDRALHCRHLLLEGGWAENVRLHLDDRGCISGLECGDPTKHDPCLSGYVVPGMANLHSHGFQHLAAGLTGNRSGAGDHFWSWREGMYRLSTWVGPAQYESCLAWVYLQMLRAGFTCCGEFHYVHHQPDGRPYADPAEMSNRVLAASATTGMAVTLLPVLYGRSGFGARTVEPAQRRFCLDPDAYLGLVEACQGMLESVPECNVGAAPHSLRAVSGEALAMVLDGLPARLPLHIHIAEQPAEVRDCLRHTGARLVQWLLDHAAVDAHWCLVHATHMDAEERRRAATSGAVAGLCPTTEADLGDGFFDTVAWVGFEGALGVGSDSNVRICPAEELRWLEYGERLRTGRRNLFAGADRTSGEALYTLAAAGGARALARPAGTLAPGRKADLVELDAGHPLLEGRDPADVLDGWIFAGGAEMVRSVWVGGKRVIDQGRHRDEVRIERAFRGTLRELRAT